MEGWHISIYENKRDSTFSLDTEQNNTKPKYLWSEIAYTLPSKYIYEHDLEINFSNTNDDRILGDFFFRTEKEAVSALIQKIKKLKHTVPENINNPNLANYKVIWHEIVIIYKNRYPEWFI